MSLIRNKFVDSNNPLDDSKIKLRNNNNLKSRNAAGTADVDIVRVNTFNRIEFPSFPQVSGTPAANNDLVNKAYVDANAGGNSIKPDGSVTFTDNQSMGGFKLTNLGQPTSNGDALRFNELGIANGIATLDSSGKVPASQMQVSIMDFKGNWNASTNTPTLADGSGNQGDVYRVNVAGIRDLGSGAQTFVVGDWVIYDASGVWQRSHGGTDSVASVNGLTGAVTVNAINELTGEVTAGPAVGSQALGGLVTKDPAGAITNSGSGVKVNLLSTGGLEISSNALKVKPGDASVTVNASGVSVNLNASGAITSGVSGVAVATDNATIKISANALKGLTHKKEKFTLGASDITNQYIDLSQVAATDSIDVVVSGLVHVETVDYSVGYTSGAGSKTRISFTGDLASGGNSPLAEGDVVVVKYTYL